MYSSTHSELQLAFHNCILIWSYPLAGSYMLHMHGTCMSMIITFACLISIMTDVQWTTCTQTNYVHCSYIVDATINDQWGMWSWLKYVTEYIPLHVWWLSWMPGGGGVNLYGGQNHRLASSITVFLHMYTSCWTTLANTNTRVGTNYKYMN